MKKLILSLIILLSLISCTTIKISNDNIIVIKQYKIARPYYYKYFYKCDQLGTEVRVYSNEVYTKGQIIKIQ